MEFIFVTDETSQEDMSPLKLRALLNIPLTSVTLDISQALISLLKRESSKNKSVIFVTELTSHTAIPPNANVAAKESTPQRLTAASRLDLDEGVKYSAQTGRDFRDSPSGYTADTL